MATRGNHYGSGGGGTSHENFYKGRGGGRGECLSVEGLGACVRARADAKEKRKRERNTALYVITSKQTQAATG
jgi:hypothetical protein